MNLLLNVYSNVTCHISEFIEKFLQAMNEIVVKWLEFRLGLLANKNSEVFAASFSNGLLIGKILYLHDFITLEELALLVESKNVEVTKRNFKHIRIWLNNLNIECSEEVISRIINVDAEAAIRLMHSIFLTFINQGSLMFVAFKMIQNQIMLRSKTRFEVNTVYNEHVESVTKDNTLTQYIESNQHIVAWMKVRQQALLERFREKREKYHSYMQESKKPLFVPERHVNMEMRDSVIIMKRREVEPSYEELQEEQKKVRELEVFVPQQTVADQIVKKLQTAHVKQDKDDSLKTHLQKHLILDMFEMVEKSISSEFEESVKKKLLRLAGYEKQMINKMIRVKRSVETILEHVGNIEKEISDEQENISMRVIMKQRDETWQRHNIFILQQQRNDELQNRLIAERDRLNTERIYKFCRETLDSIVNVAIRYVEFHEHFGMLPFWRVLRPWFALVIRGQPIFNILEYPAEVISYRENDTFDLELNELYLKEIDRQNQIDIINFEDFMQIGKSWRHHIPDQNVIDVIFQGLKIIGFIVHRLLLSKYPKPPLPTTQDLPATEIAVSLIGVTDLNMIPLLEKILENKKIKVIQLEDAINHCLEAYKEECCLADICDKLTEITNATLQDFEEKKSGKKYTQKNRWRKGKKFSNKSHNDDGKFDLDSITVDSAMELPATVQIDTQTPKVFPVDDVKYSKKGELGKIAFEMLNVGDPLPQRVLTSLLSEYLKSFKDIKGWVLINYPRTMEEASLLEETLTGKECLFDFKSTYDYPNIDDLINLELRETNILAEYDVNAKFRRSYIYENPIPVKPDKYYKTYLTGFVVMNQIVEGNKSCYNLTRNKKDSNDFNQFYMDKGCYYNFHYTVLDFATVKLLGKLITNDHLGVSAKTSLEAFGETVKYLNENICQRRLNFAEFSKKGKKVDSASKISICFDDESTEKLNIPIKKHKGKASKKTATKASKNKPAEIIIEKIDKATQEPEEVERSLRPKSERPKPAEPDWNYMSLEIPKRFVDVLATMWEYIEEIFCMDFREMFFVHRIGLDGKIPFIYYVKRISMLVLLQPDNKQHYIENFQKLYNEIDDDLREDVEMKAEIHFRIEELRTNLSNIVDENLERSLDLRRQLIKLSNLSKEIYMFVYYYFVGYDLEMNRSFNTLRLLMDYYTAMITKEPCWEQIIDDFQLRTEVTFEDNEEYEAIYNFLCDVLNLKGVYGDSNPIITIIENNYKKCIDAVETAITNSKNYAAKIQTFLNSKDSKNFPEDVLKRSQDVMEEWYCTISGEYNRILVKLQMLRDEALNQMREISEYNIETSVQMLEIALERKRTENEAISIVCDIFARATEAETKLQQHMLLEGDFFCMQPDIIEFTDSLPPPEEKTHDLYEIFFDVEELEKLTDILLQISPNFVILERTLVYVLQDLMMHHVKDRKSMKMPNFWYSLKPAQISSIIPKLFGMEPYLDWREFIIYNLNIPFPTSSELLNVREQFRNFDPNKTECVLIYQFRSVRFWFEKSFHKKQKLPKIKDLVGRLYSVKEDYVNYSKLLLTFCKDEQFIKGVAKALELSLGNYVCSNEVEGNEFIENFRMKCLRMEEHKENVEMVQDLLNIYLDECEILDEFSGLDLTDEEGSSFDYIFTEESSHHSSLKDEPAKIYFLPLNTLVVVLSASILSFSQTECRKRLSIRARVVNIFQTLRNKEFGNRVFVHELLNCKTFQDLFKRNFKFNEKYLPKIIMQTFQDGVEQ